MKCFNSKILNGSYRDDQRILTSSAVGGGFVRITRAGRLERLEVQPEPANGVFGVGFFQGIRTTVVLLVIGLQQFKRTYSKQAISL